MRLAGKRWSSRAVIVLSAVAGGFILYFGWPENIYRETPPSPRTSTTHQPKAGNIIETEPEEGPRASVEPRVESSVAGVVVDSHGAPIDGAIVAVDPVGDVTKAMRRAGLPTSDVSAVSGSDGLFRLTLPTAEIEITFAVWCEGYLPSKELVFVPNGGISDLRFELKRPSSISGYVVNSRFRPVSHIIVGAIDEATTRSEALGPTRADGRFVIEEIPPGEYRIYCRYVPTERPHQYQRGLPIGDIELCPDQPLLTVKLDEGEKLSSLRVVIPWDPDRKIQGMVRDEAGRPITDAFTWVEVTGNNLPIQLAEKRSDVAGRFSIECVPDGGENLCMPQIDSVTVAAEADGYETARLESIPVGSRGLVITLQVAQHGIIRGSVVDAATSAPIPTAKVLLLGVESSTGDAWSAGPIGKLVKRNGGEVSQDGSFLFDKVRPGSGTLIAFAADYGVSKHVVTIDPGETSDVTIKLMRAGRLQLTTKYVGELEGRMAECIIECRPFDDQSSFSVITPEMYSDILKRPRKSPGPVGEGTYELDLQPGEYGIILGTRIFFEDDVLTPMSMNYQGFYADVQSNQITSIEVPAGGSGTVVGSANGGQGEKMYGYLVAGSDISLLNDTLDHRTLALEYGVVMIERIGEAFEFRAVPAGVYTLAIIKKTPDGNTIIGPSKTFAVGNNESVSVEFAQEH
jgi:hypothetical protein